ncbi:hypothetical protein ABK040_005694 [Willaertia magna]
MPSNKRRLENFGLHDNTVCYEEILLKKLNKTCCKKNHLFNFKKWIKENVNNLEELDNYYIKFTCESLWEKSRKNIYNFLQFNKKISKNNKFKYNFSILGKELCRKGFTMLFCNENLLQRVINESKERKFDENNNCNNEVNNCNNDNELLLNDKIEKNLITCFRRIHFNNYFQFYIDNSNQKFNLSNEKIQLPTSVTKEEFYNSYSKYFSNVEVKSKDLICDICFKLDIRWKSTTDEEKDIIKKERKIHNDEIKTFR